MINLLVDEGYAFDYLAILRIKYNRTNNPDVAGHLAECERSVLDQIKSKLFSEVKRSKEYHQLYESNLQVFDSIEKLRSGQDISAKEIDDLNTARFICKKNLQNKFFKTPIKEFKTTNGHSSGE